MQIPILFLISLVALAMGQKEAASYNDLLLDNINLVIDITSVSIPKEVSTPSLLNICPSESLQNTKASSSDKSNIAKMENYIDQKFYQPALNHLKSQIITEIKNDIDNNNTSINQQFHIESFSIPFRLDRNIYGGGFLLYVRNNAVSLKVMSSLITWKLSALKYF